MLQLIWLLLHLAPQRLDNLVALILWSKNRGHDSWHQPKQGTSLVPYICSVWFPQNGWHLMIPVKIDFDDLQNQGEPENPKRQTIHMQPDILTKNPPNKFLVMQKFRNPSTSFRLYQREKKHIQSSSDSSDSNRELKTPPSHHSNPWGAVKKDWAC